MGFNHHLQSKKGSDKSIKHYYLFLKKMQIFNLALVCIKFHFQTDFRIKMKFRQVHFNKDLDIEITNFRNESHHHHRHHHPVLM